MDILINDICFTADFHSLALSEISSVLERGENVAIACSGGADSVFALFAMLDIFKAHRHQIKVLHYNHKTRQSAYADENFVITASGIYGTDSYAYMGDTQNSDFLVVTSNKCLVAVFKNSSCKSRGSPVKLPPKKAISV